MLHDLTKAEGRADSSHPENSGFDVYYLLNKLGLKEKDKLVKEKETSKGLLASITKLTNEKKELEKENIFLKARGLFNRILNKQYKKEDVPEIVEAEVNSTSEE